MYYTKLLNTHLSHREYSMPIGGMLPAHTISGWAIIWTREPLNEFW